MSDAVLCGIAAGVLVLGGVLILLVIFKVACDIVARKRWFR